MTDLIMSATPDFPDVHLHIAGEWTQGRDGKAIGVVNPATGATIGQVACAGVQDLERAVEAAQRGFGIWRITSAFDRSKVLRKTAEILRERVQETARLLTLEQGKPLKESKLEINGAADMLDWLAEEARRTYGRVIPARSWSVSQQVLLEPVGPVAAFTPWNFPINQAVKKLGAALASGCSIVLKGPEDTPGSCAALVRAFLDAGLPPDVLSLVFGDPAQISTFLISHSAIRKISFTGSTSVGKQLAALAGLHMKKTTMELGGHAPAIVFKDADLDIAASVLSANKYRNAGQVCVAPTRFLVADEVFDDFLGRFVEASEQLSVGDGMDPNTQMGPLVHARRRDTIERQIVDATSRGAILQTGGRRIGNEGYYFAPTVLTDVPLSAELMHDEPFGPIAIFRRFSDLDDALGEANRLPFGLAAYAYTDSAAVISRLSNELEVGMLSVNHHGLSLPETPFGGVKDSGYGSEGGSEATEAYLVRKFLSVATQPNLPS
jgi:succinate-semialdehyde dehydrogenase/glutarate-semialdehyde dehydrogenase